MDICMCTYIQECIHRDVYALFLTLLLSKKKLCSVDLSVCKELQFGGPVLLRVF